MTASVAQEAPLVPPSHSQGLRETLAAELLRGSGIEIGALHLPMQLPAGTRVRYVDRMTVPDLRAHYPELAELELAPVDIVDDGEQLRSVPAESVDFIIANHFLEHCEDPIRTIETHLEKLRPGGILFYAVPDKRYTFDFRRPVTPLAHIIADYEHGPAASRAEHYREWVRYVDGSGADPSDPDAVAARAAELDAEGYSIHFHVWTQSELLELILHIQQRLATFDLEAFRPRSLENILILRKHGPVALPAPAGETTVPARRGGAPVPAISEPVSVAVAGLRVRLDAAYARAHWALNAPGAPGRALVQDTGGPVTIGLRLGGPVTLTAHARLVPHDWREGSGALRAFIETTDAHGHHHRLWTGTLASAERNGNPDGLPITVALAPDTTELRFDLEQINVRDGRAVGRLMWIEPTLTDPHAPATPTPPAPDPLAPVTAPEHGPLISVLTPVHDPPPHMLEEAIASVRAQTYPHWELCLLDDGSRNPEIIHALHRHAASDPRIHLHRHDTAQGISAATNAALAHATGDYIALLDHDDTLTPDALAHVAHHINHNPHLDMLYSDEDIVMDGKPVWVHFKQAWSPETLETNGYTCHLGVYRRTAVSDIGGFRSEFNGSQDVDMILRLTERTDQIGHIPHILYHWRAHAESTAGGDAKPYAYVAAQRAIAAHLEREGHAGARVEFGPPGLYRVVHEVDPHLSTVIALCVNDTDGLAEAARSWLGEPHENWKLAIAAPEASMPAVSAALLAAGMPQTRLLLMPGHSLASAVRTLDTAHLILMETPAAGITHGWMTRLLGYSAKPGVAVAGALVLSAEGQVRDAGVALPDGVPLALLHGSAGTSMDAHFGFGTSVHNVTAVSGVAAIARHALHELGGLDPDLGDLALVELCLRARAAGARIVTVPDARLRATTPDTTINDLPNLWRIRQTWRTHHTHDPYYNSNLRPDRGDFAPRETLA